MHCTLLTQDVILNAPWHFVPSLPLIGEREGERETPCLPPFLASAVFSSPAGAAAAIGPRSVMLRRFASNPIDM